MNATHVFLRWGALVGLLGASVGCDEAAAPGSVDAGQDAAVLEPDAAPIGCFQHGECEVFEVCRAEACASMFPGTYELTVENLAVGPTDLEGAAWDPGSAPDIQVAVRVEGRGEIARSALIRDSQTPSFPEPLVFELFDRAQVALVVYDIDEPGDATPTEQIVEQVALDWALLARQGGMTGYVADRDSALRNMTLDIAVK